LQITEYFVPKSSPKKTASTTTTTTTAPGTIDNSEKGSSTTATDRPANVVGSEPDGLSNGVPTPNTADASIRPSSKQRAPSASVAHIFDYEVADDGDSDRRRRRPSSLSSFATGAKRSRLGGGGGGGGGGGAQRRTSARGRGRGRTRCDSLLDDGCGDGVEAFGLDEVGLEDVETVAVQHPEEERINERLGQTSNDDAICYICDVVVDLDEAKQSTELIDLKSYIDEACQKNTDRVTVARNVLRMFEEKIRGPANAEWRRNRDDRSDEMMPDASDETPEQEPVGKWTLRSIYEHITLHDARPPSALSCVLKSQLRLHAVLEKNSLYRVQKRIVESRRVSVHDLIPDNKTSSIMSALEAKIVATAKALDDAYELQNRRGQISTSSSTREGGGISRSTTRSRSGVSSRRRTYGAAGSSGGSRASTVSVRTLLGSAVAGSAYNETDVTGKRSTLHDE
jgi:hypothetical protein